MAATVLVVDDEVRIRKLVSAFLERRGYQVLTARDGWEAIAMFETHSPQLLVTDINMPGLNGLELLRWVRSRPAIARLPVIILSAHHQELDGESTRADALLPKPIELSTLVGLIESLLASAGGREGVENG